MEGKARGGVAGERYQLKTVNACLQNPDIVLPTRPTPGAFVAFYTTQQRSWEGHDSAAHALRNGGAFSPSPLPQSESASPSPPSSSSRRGARTSERLSPVTTKRRRRQRGREKAMDEVIAAAVHAGEGNGAEEEEEDRGVARRPSVVWPASPTVFGTDGGRGGTVPWARLAAKCKRRGARTPPPDPSASPSSPCASPSLATTGLTPSQWMKSVAHVVVGRHPRLPYPFRLSHPCVSRAHARVVFVGSADAHVCLTSWFPPLFPRDAGHGAADSRRRGGSARQFHRQTTEGETGEEEQEGEQAQEGEEEEEEEEEKESGLVVSQFDYTKPYYLLLSHGENPLYVNGLCVPAGYSWPLAVGHVVSFLEDALDVAYGVVSQDSAKMEGRRGGEGRRGAGAEGMEDSAPLSSVPGLAVCCSSPIAGGSADASGEGVASDGEGGGQRPWTARAPLAGSPPPLDVLLRHCLRVALAAPGSAASSAVLRFTAGAYVLSLRPGAVEVRPALRHFTERWMKLTSALRAGSNPPADGGRVRRFLEQLATAVESVAGHRRVTEEGQSPFLDDDDDDDDDNIDIAGEVMSPLQARLTLDLRALRDTHRRLLSQALERGLVGAPRRAADPAARPFEAVLWPTSEFPPPMEQHKQRRGSRSSSGSYLVSSIKPESHSDDGEEAERGNEGKWGVDHEEQETPVKRLLRQLRGTEKETEAETAKSKSSSNAAVAASDHAGGADLLLSRHRARDGERSCAAEDEGRGEWLERREDERGSPLPEEGSNDNDNDDGRGSPPLRPASTLFAKEDAREADGSGGLRLETLLSAEEDDDDDALSVLPGLAFHPAMLPVYVFTRRSPSPDATTTRFARQSRAANRDAANPDARPEYVFYYSEEEEEQEGFDGARQPKTRRGASGGQDDSDESVCWIDEAEAEARKGKRRRRRAPPTASADANGGGGGRGRRTQRAAVQRPVRAPATRKRQPSRSVQTKRGRGKTK